MPVDIKDQSYKTRVIGPDGKGYWFKKTTSTDKINQYFINKGWQLKDGKWYTNSGEEVSKLTGFGGIPSSNESFKRRTDKLHQLEHFKTDVAIASVGALPGVLGAVGGMLGRTPGAAIGGMLGEGAKDFVRGDLYSKKISPGEYVRDMSIEGAKQAAFEKGGQKLGDIFFNLLNKMPHAVTKKGIPLLPGDVNPDSKLMKYVEDLLSNLAPSSKIMAGFKEKQNKAIVDQVTKLANGFAKFNGTSEELGVLLQNSVTKQREIAQANLKIQLKSLKGVSKTSPAYIKYMSDLNDFHQTFNNELMKAVVKTEKPELIAGWFRTDKSGLENTRIMFDLLHETNPDLISKTQNRLMRDVINETLTGSKDPTIKGNLTLTKSFSGGKFKEILDRIGEDKLKVLYGQKGYDSITKFEDLIAHVDKTQGSGVGRFLNLMFILPFRAGTSIKAVGKLSGLAFAANRAAKIITSPEGMKIYENYIRATTQQAPRAISIARDEIIAFNEKSDEEYNLEEKIAEDEYKKDMPTIQSADFGSEVWRAKQLQ